MGLPGDAGEAAAESLAGATVVADQLPAQTGAALLEAPRVAFTSGFNAAGGVSAGLAVFLAVLSASLLRRVRPMGAEPASSGSAPPHIDQEAAGPTGRPSPGFPAGRPNH